MNPHGNGPARNHVVVHALDPDDAVIVEAIRNQSRASKGELRDARARGPFDAVMEQVAPRAEVGFEPDVVGGVAGLWVEPRSITPEAVLLHLHGGWFNFGSANAYRHLVAHLAARAGVRAFVPDYRLAPEHRFPAAIDDALACYGALSDSHGRLVVTGDSAGGNLALALASQLSAAAHSGPARLLGVAALSPITDLTLAGESYQTRAEADPYFTRAQAAELVQAYLGDADPKDPLASPLHAQLAGLPPVRVHVGSDEVLLDDSRRYVERARAAGADARLEVWTGMPHGFVIGVGAIKAATRSLDAIGAFLAAAIRSGSQQPQSDRPR